MKRLPILLDRRAERGHGPSTHAFVVGVGAYPHLPKDDEPDTARSFGLRQRRSSVASVQAFVRWLTDAYRNPGAPLATCRVLLSAESPEEIAPDIVSSPASLDNFLEAAAEWREDAATHSNNVAIFCFAGHAVQLSKEQVVLLLQDFGDGRGGVLRHAVDVSTLMAGMSPSPSYPDIARTQLSLIDSDRIPPVSLSQFASLGTTAIWDIELAGIDDRNSTVIHGSSSAAAERGRGRTPSAFMHVLLEALSGAAAEWVGENAEGDPLFAVTTTSLVNGLTHGASRTGDDLTVTIGGSIRPEAIHILDRPPMVNVELSVEQETYRPGLIVRVFGEQGTATSSIDSTSARRFDLPAGLYAVQIEGPDGSPVITRNKEARAPRTSWKIRIPV